MGLLGLAARKTVDEVEGVFFFSLSVQKEGKLGQKREEEVCKENRDRPVIM